MLPHSLSLILVSLEYVSLNLFWVPFLLTLLTKFLPPRNSISFSCSLLFRNRSVLFRGSLTMFLQVPILASLVLTYLFIVCFPRLSFLGTSTCSRHFVYTLGSFFFELQVFLSDSAPAFFSSHACSSKCTLIFGLLRYFLCYFIHVVVWRSHLFWDQIVCGVLLC